MPTLNITPSDHAEELYLSPHAARRAAQRNFSYEDICFIVKYGELVRRAGACFYEMRRKNLPAHCRGIDAYERLNNVTVVVAKCGKEVTTIQRQFDSRGNKRKRKYNHRRDRSSGWLNPI
jgi:hypothetical protein